MGYGYAGMAWMWPWMLVGALLSLAVLAALVIPIIRLTRVDSFDTHSPAGTAKARRILDERYARGEIDEDDYHTRRDNLG